MNTNIDIMDTYHIAEAINNEDKKIADSIGLVLPQITQAVDVIYQSLNQGGRMGYFGAGTSGKIAILDATDCPQTFGVSENQIQSFIAGGDECIRASINGAEDSAEMACQDIKSFNPTPQDIVVSISASGNPQYVISILEEAKKYGCTTIGITSNSDAKFKPFADIFINPILGEEVVIGSSRMKSGTAQKMILNMLTTGAMIRIGKTYENYMIDVRMMNEKLVDRGCRIVSDIAKVPYEDAQKYVEASGNKVKIACVMAAKKCSKEEAERLINDAKGIIRKIIS